MPALCRAYLNRLFTILARPGRLVDSPGCFRGRRRPALAARWALGRRGERGRSQVNLEGFKDMWFR